MSLCGHNSGANSVRELFKPSKDSASLQKIFFFVLCYGFFVSDVISEIDLGLFCAFHLALGLDHWMVVFC